MEKNGFCDNNNVKLIQSGRTYFDLMKSHIIGSKKEIIIHAYIFKDDITGEDIIKSLIEASNRNCKVFVLVDGIASSISNENIHRLRQAGVYLQFFEPFLRGKSYYFGRRLHQKIAIFDRDTALVGGINIADRYNDILDKRAWLDFAIEIKGNSVGDIFTYCKTWWDEKLWKTEDDSIFPTKNETYFGNTKIRTRRNDWTKHLNEISTSYLEMFRTAEDEIIILCSYFLPGKTIRRALIRAAQRGINIIVILAGRSDITISKHAERWLYDWLFRHKIKVYEYQKNILHGKLAICDRKWMTIGSYNMNNLSTYVSIEFNVDISDKTFCNDVRNKLQNIIDDDCKIINLKKNHIRHNPFAQFYRWLCYFFLEWILAFTTFYFKRPKGKSKTTL
ncbi:MAG: hypothetical protein RIR96_760 [Bacteroidota bacterium]